MVLVVAVAFSGLAGGAAVVAALAFLGGPFGMMGGILVLGLLVLISKALTEFGFQPIFKRVLLGLKEKGQTQAEIAKLWRISPGRVSRLIAKAKNNRKVK